MTTSNRNRKLLATMCAWALAPLSMLFVLYLPVAFYSDGLTLPKYQEFMIFLTVSYITTTIIGLPIHIGLVLNKISSLSQYAKAGAVGSAIVLFIFNKIFEGLLFQGFTQTTIIFVALFPLHGIIIATAFGWIYQRLSQPSERLNEKRGLSAIL